MILAGVMGAAGALGVSAGASAQDAPTFERPYDGVPAGRFADFGRIMPEDQINSENDDDRNVWPDDLPPRFEEEVDTLADVMTVGFGYFGQFVDHDLDFIREVQDEFLLPPFVRAAFQDENGVGQNRATAGFDLSPVYHFGPLEGESGITQGAWFDQQALRFRFGATEKKKNIDFIRTILGKAKTSDPRNDENGGVGQIHRAFMMLHNTQVSRIMEREGLDDSMIEPGDATWQAVFHEARNYTTAYYQGIVLGQYAKLLTGRTVWDALDDQVHPLTPIDSGNMPIEFAAGMYRLHTIIPQLVQIGENEFVSSIDPVLREGVDWKFYFGPDAPRAARLDSAIAADLRDIVDLKIPGVPIGITLDLAQVNILRGRELRLPSGEEYLSFLLDELGLDESTTQIRGKTVLTLESGMDVLDPVDDADIIADMKNGDTDLWVYMLIEADLNDGVLGAVAQDILERIWAGLMLVDDWSILTNPEFTEEQLEVFRNATFEELLEQIFHPALQTDFELLRGSVLSGDLDGIRAVDDDDTLVLRSAPGLTAFEPNVIDTVFGHSTEVQAALEFDIVLELAANQPGGTAHVSLLDVTTGQFEQIHSFSIGTESPHIGENTTVLSRVDATDHVDGDGRIEVRLRQVMMATFTASGFDSTIDQHRVDVYD